MTPKRLAFMLVVSILVVGAGCVPVAPPATPTPAPTFTPAATAAPTVAPATPPDEPEPMPVLSGNVSSYVTGLIYPRGLKFGPDGALYVAESGTGGDTETMGTCDGYTSMFAPYHIGLTARVSRIAPDGSRTTVAENLPAAQDQFGDVLGVSDIAFVGDTLYAVVSGGGCSRGFDDFPASVVKVNGDGSTSIVADLSAFFTAHPAAAGEEADYEPDGSANAVVVHDDKLYIVNANHGALDEVSLDGAIRRVLDLTASEGHVTPAAIASHGGDFYIGALGKFPIQVGTSKVYRVTPGGELSIFAEGLTAILGLAFDEQGRLYVLETTSVDTEYPGPGTGRVVRLSDGGALEEIATGLSFPIGMTFGPDGGLYVSNFGYGGDPAAGEVVRIDVDVAAMR
jgi:hypothetical protein